jgi:putative transposase
MRRSSRSQEDRLTCLLIVGVFPDGPKVVIALEDSYRESRESRAGVLQNLTRQGMAAPVLAIGHGNLSFWVAPRDVYPETLEQGCWKHEIANVPDGLPRRLQAKANERLHDIIYAPDREHALKQITVFDSPAEHWLRRKTANPIESTFATVKARTIEITGAGA